MFETCYALPTQCLFVIMFCQGAGYIETNVYLTKLTNCLPIFVLEFDAALFALKLNVPALPALFQLLLNNSECNFNIPQILIFNTS